MSSEAERAAQLAGIEAPPPPPDAKPKRPTTRAGRAAAAAARKQAGDKTPKAAGAKRPPSSRTVVKQSIEGLHGMGGAVATMLGKPATGALLSSSAPQAGEVWAQLAARYPAIERWLTGGGDAMVFVQLLMVYAPIVMCALNEPKNAAASADIGALLGGLAGMAGGGEQLVPEQPAPAAAA